MRMELKTTSAAAAAATTAKSIFERKQTHFVLWCPAPAAAPPRLVIGDRSARSTPTLDGERALPLALSPDSPEVWQLAAADCGLFDGRIYHYWFEVEAQRRPGRPGAAPVTDPVASRSIGGWANLRPRRLRDPFPPASSSVDAAGLSSSRAETPDTGDIPISPGRPTIGW